MNAGEMEILKPSRIKTNTKTGVKKKQTEDLEPPCKGLFVQRSFIEKIP